MKFLYTAMFAASLLIAQLNANALERTSGFNSAATADTANNTQIIELNNAIGGVGGQLNTLQETLTSVSNTLVVIDDRVDKIIACNNNQMLYAPDHSDADAGGCLLVLPPEPGSEAFEVPGTYTFTVPERITRVQVRVYGAGGGTANNHAYGQSISCCFGGGGGGGYAEKILKVTPGQEYSVVVGVGGCKGTRGGTSSFDGTTISATGGYSATSNSGRPGGSGNGGDINKTGGSGGNPGIGGKGIYAFAGGGSGHGYGNGSGSVYNPSCSPNVHGGSGAGGPGAVLISWGTF